MTDGPRTRFEADRAKIARGCAVAVIVAVVLAGVFLAVAIYGPIHQRRLDNPEGALVMQVAGYAFVVGALCLGAVTTGWIGREVESWVEIRPDKLVIQSRGRIRTLPWREIKQVFKTNSAALFGMGGLLGLLFLQLMSGGEHQTVMLELNDGSRLTLPPFVANRPAMFEMLKQKLAEATQR